MSSIQQFLRFGFCSKNNRKYFLQLSSTVYDTQGEEKISFVVCSTIFRVKNLKRKEEKFSQKNDRKKFSFEEPQNCLRRVGGKKGGKRER